MLDPQVQKKGGFGAFVAHEHENTEVREAAEAHTAADAAAKTTTPDAAPAPAAGTPRR